MWNAFWNQPQQQWQHWCDPADQMQDMMQHRFHSSGGRSFAFNEKSEKYVISADMPGLGEEDVNLEISGRMLTISGEKTAEDGEGRKSSRSYKRTISLPHDVDEDNIEATMSKGVLQLSLPKRQEVAKRRIPIAGASEGKAPAIEE